MFKLEEICELIRLVGSTKVASVEVEHAGSRVKIEGAAVTGVAPVVTAAPAAVLEHDVGTGAQPQAMPEAAAALNEEESLHVVTSPIVGTFYRAPNPEADPYVKAGDFVEKGQTLCIVEAMKLMNEIECDATGTIVKVYQENAEPVEYGQPLFALRS